MVAVLINRINLVQRRKRYPYCMMNGERERYKCAVNSLLSLADFERKSRANQPPDWHLRRVERLMEMLGEPHLATPVVHVAGSKGKGSTCAMIASGLKAAGFRTGLYTSPHLHTFTERIQLNGNNISRSDFADLIDRLWPYVDAIEQAGDLGVVSVFEMLTAMAFVHFRDHADIAVIETGLGGRLDATNVVAPEVAVITSISLDHVRILGDKISLIAREKAGIIKPGKPTVVAKNHPVTWRVIRERATEVDSEVFSACETSPVSQTARVLDDDLRQEFTIKRWRAPKAYDVVSSELALIPYPDPGQKDIRTRTSLLGAHQIDNARTAATALNLLYRTGHTFDLNAAIQGISDAAWPCRTEIVNVEGLPPVILDGAHNDASLKALKDMVGSYFGSVAGAGSGKFRGIGTEFPYVFIVGSTEGHDHEAMMLELARSAHTTIATQSRHPKSVPASGVAQIGRENGLKFRETYSVDMALETASDVALANPEIGMIIVAGSLFVAAEAREALLDIEPELYDDLAQPYMLAYEDTDVAKGKIGTQRKERNPDARRYRKRSRGARGFSGRVPRTND